MLKEVIAVGKVFFRKLLIELNTKARLFWNFYVPVFHDWGR